MTGQFKPAVDESIDVVGFTSDRTTSVMATLVYTRPNSKHRTYRFIGTADAHPEDDYDLETGEKLAMGRALQAMGAKLKNEANREIKKSERKRRASKAKQLAKLKARKEKSARYAIKARASSKN